MRITIHGHRPFFLRPSANTATRTPAAVAQTADLPPVETQRNINLGFFKLKVHRQTARQAELVSLHQAQQQPQPNREAAPTAAPATAPAQNPATATATASLGSPARASELHAERAPTPTRDVADEHPRAEVEGQGLDLRDNLTEHLAARLDALRARRSQMLPQSGNQFSRLVGNALVPDTPRQTTGTSLRFSRLHTVTPASRSPITAPSTPRTPVAQGQLDTSPALSIEAGLLMPDLSEPGTPTTPPRRAIEPDSRTPDQAAYSPPAPPRLRQRPRGQTLVDMDMLPTLPLLGHPVPLTPGQEPYSARLRYLPQRLFDDVGALNAQALVPRSLGQAVTAWSQEPAAANTWDGFAEEPGAQAFSGFLDRLRGSVNFRNPEFRASVAKWLPELAANPALRRDTFLVSEGATTSCEDRIALSFNEMQKLRLASDVARGDYDGRIPELMNLARGMFRLDQLEQISREHVAGGPSNVDPIEVYLAYQVKLREPLKLPVETRSMRFFNVAGVTSQDLSLAQERVSSAEQKEFPDYLASDWQPWQAVMQRMAPERYAESRDELIDALGDEFRTRLQGRLRGMGLENDSDAEREMGPQVQAEITREINGRLTKDFLAERGLSDILSSPQG